MDREALKAYIDETLAGETDHPWARYPDYVVFRHTGNRKWFALLMCIPREKLGLPGGGLLDVLNVKCDPRMVGSLLAQEGFHPAYHMNKDHWVSILLDDTVPDETLFPLVELSWDSVAPRRKIRKTERNEP